jgi:integrase
MATPKFHLRTSKEKIDLPGNLSAKSDGTSKYPIDMLYSFNGQRLKYYTKVSIEQKYYRPECNKSDRIKPIKTTAPFADSLNTRLMDMALDAVRIVNESKVGNITKEYVRHQLDLIYKSKQVELVSVAEVPNDFIVYFEQFINDCKSGKRLVKKTGKDNGKRYKHNAIKNYGVTLSAVNRFMRAHRIKTLTFNDIDKRFYESFRNYCFNIENKEVSTFGGYVKDFKSLLNELKPTNYNAKDFVIPTYESDTIYLNDEQITAIGSLDLSAKTNFVTRQVTSRDKQGKAILDEKGNRCSREEKISYGVLGRTRDLFLVGCYTGLRFGNFSNLLNENIQGNLIRVEQIKTGGKVTIPIMKGLVPVLAKYPTGLPTLSNQKFNDYIKFVAQLAGLTEMVKIKNTKGNKDDSGQYPLFSLISSHTCRRSYATNLFKKKVPAMLIMSATGHTSEKSFLKYIRASNEEKAHLLAAALNDLGI